jgi:outer membrane protein assembly factor BamB
MRTRRTLLAALGPLALTGCGITDMFDDWFAAKKDPLPGKRELVSFTAASDAPQTDKRPVVLPPAVINPSWELPGGVATHALGSLAGPAALDRAWRADIGEGGGYRRRVTAQPIVAEGRIYTMDSDAVVRCFALADGARVWSADTKPEKNRSTNVGGGLSYAAGVLYAATGLAELLALDPRTGAIKWRVTLPTPARSGPTIVDGKLFLPTVDSRVLARAADGKPLWSYDGSVSPAGVLGAPAPAAAEGFVIAGAGNGELVALRADSGVPVWSDSFGSVATSLVSSDFSAVRGLPVVADGRVYATSLGGQTGAVDLRSGRRLWTRALASPNTPWLAGDTLFLLTADQVIMALARDDGATRWQTELPRYKRPEKQRDPITWFGPSLIGGRLVAVSNHRKLVQVDPVSGKAGDLIDLPGEGQFGPTAAGGTLLLITADGTLAAYR